MNNEGYYTLNQLGFNTAFAAEFRAAAGETLDPARVTLEHKSSYVVYTEQGEMPAQVTGRIHYEAEFQGMPVVGDWVAVRILDEWPPRAVIHDILPRKSKFSRKEAGSKTGEQVLATNIDTVFIVTGLDHNFRVRRIERYLTVAWESGASPVLLLTKADLCDDVEEKVRAVEKSAVGVPVHALSVFANQGLEVLDNYLKQGQTAAFLGSSGVGKSTVVNYLLGEDVQKVQEVREMDSRGRHTTTRRQLFILPSGAMVIDTPGMRELQLWDAGEGLSETFDDIEEIAEGCKFRNCRHENEPGCKVREALKNKQLDRGRFENYRKMQKELSYLERKQEVQAALIEKEKWKKIHKAIRNLEKK